MTWALALSAPQVLLSMGPWRFPAEHYVLWALATPVVLVFGWPFFRHAWQLARHRTAGMDTLVALSTGTTYAWSVFNTVYPTYLQTRGLPADVYFEAASVIIAFILLGKWLEDRAKASASDALRHLMTLRPSTVLLERRDGTTREVSLREVVPGDRLLIRPGERVGVDGVVEEGDTYIDESTLSGESLPVPKREGDPVFAGTLNQQGAFRMRADKVGEDTLLAGIIRQVRLAQGSKAPVQRLVDKVAAVFVPSVLGIALVSFALWWGLGGTSALPHAFLALVTVLVIACPCALGLATPTALMVGIGRGAAMGIFVKDAASLERLRDVRALILDKTGTLTEGRPQVEAFHWIVEPSPQVKAVLYSLEKSSGHPLGAAIASALEEEGSPVPAGSAPQGAPTGPAAAGRIQQGVPTGPAAVGRTPQGAPGRPAMAGAPLPLLPLQDLRSLVGSGIEGVFVRSVYRVGRLDWLRSQGVDIPAALSAWVAQREATARTVVVYAKDKEALGGIVLFDRLRPGARAVVDNLRGRGIQVHLLTGDNAATAASIAAETGISSYRAGLLPGDKAAFVRSLQGKGQVVAMAGDGVNDAEALAVADVGIAMGSGTDVAMDVAGITLVQARLDRLPAALDLSVKTFRVIRQNLGFAFVYNVIGIPLAAGALYPAFGLLLHPMIAGAAMALSSVTVVGNSLRIKRNI